MDGSGRIIFAKAGEQKELFLRKNSNDILVIDFLLKRVIYFSVDKKDLTVKTEKTHKKTPSKQ